MTDIFLIEVWLIYNAIVSGVQQSYSGIYSLFFILFSIISYWIWFPVLYSRSLISVQFSHSVVSDSLQPHEPQHTRPPCPSPTPGVYPNSCPLSQRCHLTISSSVFPFSSCHQVFASIRVFSNELGLAIRWPEYWSFSISPPSEYSGLISFRMDWLDILAVQGTLESSPTPQFKSINSLVLSLYGPILTSVHD